MKTVMLIKKAPYSLLLLKLSLFFFFLILKDTSIGQCIATSPLSGSVASNDNSTGSLVFNNTAYAMVSDNNRATSTAIVALFTGNSEYLKITGFGFTIPSYASICGIKVDIEKRAQGVILGAWIRDNEIKLVKGNIVTGNNLATNGNWGTSDSYYTHGDEANLWGTALTPADVNASDFGIAISAKFNGLVGVFPSSQIDNVLMTVYYNPILPIKIISFNSSLSNNKVTLQWETADEEEGEYITLQRSDKNETEWKDIASFESHQYNMTHKNNYSDYLLKNGTYAYRLKVTNKDKQNNYSEIKNVVYAGVLEKPVVFPNPARDYITITNIYNTENIRITNMTMQSIDLPIHVIDEHTVKISLSRLSPGLYVVGTDGYKMKFIKE